MLKEIIILTKKIGGLKMKFKKTFKALALLLGVTSIIAGCGANNS
ncbi:hypothetical protein QTH07_02410 [Clostridium perfringens]|nr:hypothetical protein [Clostridium perfringens]